MEKIDCKTLAEINIILDLLLITLLVIIGVIKIIGANAKGKHLEEVEKWLHSQNIVSESIIQTLNKLKNEHREP